jgi:hypothetical protein
VVAAEGEPDGEVVVDAEREAGNEQPSCALGGDRGGLFLMVVAR